jgi:hypothetical protein
MRHACRPRNRLQDGAGGGGRTPARLEPHGILSYEPGTDAGRGIREHGGFRGQERGRRVSVDTTKNDEGRILPFAALPRLAQKLSGHKTESIYRRYVIVSETDLAEGVGRVAAPRDEGVLCPSSRP